MAELDEILKRYTDPATGPVHGATFVAVDSKGNDLYCSSFGSRTVDRSEPLTPDTLTWIASQSKLVTSVAGMQMVEKGLIGLDDDVREVVPALEDVKVLLGFEGENETADDLDLLATLRAGGKVDFETIKPKGEPIYEDVKGKITLRQLMSHTSGFCYDVGNPLILKWSAQRGRKENMFSGTIGGSTHPPVFQPGTSWAYGPGLDWVGQVVEALTKKDLDTYMQENIWRPLDATRMTFHPTKHFSPNPMPPLHESAVRSGSSLAPEPGTSPWPLEARDAIGGAGLYGSATDYIKLLSCLLQGGAPLLEKASSVDELFRPQIGEASTQAFRNHLLMGVGHRLFRQSGDEATKDELMPVGHSLVGQSNMLDVEGRRKKGSVSWGGLPNLAWLIDREGGVAATLFTQILPAGDMLCREMVVELEAALYRLKGQKGEE
ncbi:beta-lactamase [Cladophialophora yegresii CBS 114405]|uniref:Beta-lactamase n=1 Tax=Cladophialophora yegresii CBS 114405 TaxID=1182544 RepID=W9VWF4_9EURO|nr:beta-lactamase [Cladophialophora yegresii CBS 114405]EXJ59998.1 beta-lactamase [Cladophialophora yegresii CBS 114405]